MFHRTSPYIHKCLCNSQYNLTGQSKRYKTHYEVLGVPKTASEKEIRAAFLKHVKQLHPDTNTDTKCHEKFVNINEAYNILKSPASRAKYDATIVSLYHRPSHIPRPQKVVYKTPKNFEERWQYWKQEEDDILTNRPQNSTNEKIHWQFHLFGLAVVVGFLVLTQFAPNLDNIGAGVHKHRLINEENKRNAQKRTTIAASSTSE